MFLIRAHKPRLHQAFNPGWKIYFKAAHNGWSVLALIRVLIIRISQPTFESGSDCVRSGLAVSKHKGLILRCCTCSWVFLACSFLSAKEQHTYSECLLSPTKLCLDLSHMAHLEPSTSNHTDKVVQPTTQKNLTRIQSGFDPD